MPCTSIGSRSPTCAIAACEGDGRAFRGAGGMFQGEPAQFASSSLARRGFCRDCGTPLSFAYNTPEARIYITIGSMDDPELARIEIQYGVEAKIGWVQFCEDVPGEVTGESAAAQEFLAQMTSNQS